MGDVIAKLEKGRPRKAWLAAGLDLADESVVAARHFDVRQNIDLAIWAAGLNRDVLQLDYWHFREQRFQRVSGAALQFIH
jgi:hypothetical protein